MTINKRETEKFVKIKGRNFKIEKFDAHTGGYLFITLLQKFLPVAKQKKMGLADFSDAGGLLRQNLLDKEEFISLKNDCLSCVYESLKAGYRAVINDNGSWGVADLENDTVLVLVLIIHALEFNFSDFFSEENSQALASALQSLGPLLSLI